MTYPTYQEANDLIARWENDMRNHIEQSILRAFHIPPDLARVSPDLARVGFFNRAPIPRHMTIDRHMERAVSPPVAPSFRTPVNRFDPHIYHYKPMTQIPDQRPPADAQEILVCNDAACPCHQWKPGMTKPLYNVLHYRRDQQKREEAQQIWKDESRRIREHARTNCFDWRASKRGRTLLREHLSRSQWDSMRKNGFIDVKGGVTGHTYRIYYGSISNVATYPPDGRDETYCVTGQGAYGDIVLMQKILIESDEEAFKTLANTELKWYPDGIRHPYQYQ